MEKLRKQLDDLLGGLADGEKIRSAIADLISVYPFSEFEYMISHLLAADKLTLDQYYQLRDEYIDRNLYLYLFEISAPRGFGEMWAHGHLKELVPALQRPSRKIDADYSGQYDFFLEPGIRIEVKASRAVDFKSDEPLYVKALASDSNLPFDMNFQQIKPKCCDVFVWIAAWRDAIRYWVIPSQMVESNEFYSPGQHRGNVGEGQLHVKHDNIRHFEKYRTKPENLEKTIRRAYEQEVKGRKAQAQ